MSAPSEATRSLVREALTRSHRALTVGELEGVTGLSLRQVQRAIRSLTRSGEVFADSCRPRRHSVRNGGDAPVYLVDSLSEGRWHAVVGGERHEDCAHYARCLDAFARGPFRSASEVSCGGTLVQLPVYLDGLMLERVARRSCYVSSKASDARTRDHWATSRDGSTSWF